MRNEFRRILVATSSSIAAETIAEQAVKIADGLNAELIAVHVNDESSDFADGQLALKKFAELGERYEVPVSRVASEESMVIGIVKVAEESKVTLILMGLGIDRELSEISQRVSELTKIPVLVIPQSVRTFHCST